MTLRLSGIVATVFGTVWQQQKSLKDTNDWLNIANEFYQRMHFHNYMGALRGKHIWITVPSGYGSLFYNYKHFSSVVLGLIEENYSFIALDVGAVEKSSDFHGFKNSVVGRKLELNQLVDSRLLPSDDDGKCMPFVILGDELSTLLKHALQPHLNRNLSIQQWIYNYRLTRACWMVEYAFGIMANNGGFFTHY